MSSEISVDRGNSIDRISENIYGHFAEHLGRCIYGGIWVGEDEDRVETEDGIRTDTVELLEDLEIPVLRWPGGCFADDYHWEDGVGPRDERPRRRNLWWSQGREDVFEESNEFGTDEFLHLTELLDTEAYLAVNVGSSTPQEALDWIEYCNFDGDTELTRRRAENGHPEPYDVKYWGIGNENWGCGGRYAPDEYGDQYRRFANYLRGFNSWLNPGDTEFIACGHITEGWNDEFFETLEGAMEFGPGTFLGMGSPYELMDHFSVHRYYQAGGDADFTDDQHYRIFARAQKIGGDIDRAAEVIDEYTPEGFDIGIIVDEWGVWHPEAVPDNGLEQENTVRDALTTAGVFDLFHERADVVSMANIAQTVNVLQCMVQTDEDDAWATPTYHVFDLYSRHKGNVALKTAVDTETKRYDEEDHSVEMVSASASEGDDEVVVTASNRHLDHTETVQIDVGEELSVADATLLFDDLESADYSTKDNADEFEPAEADVSDQGDGTFLVELPPTSVVGVTFAE
jgi:alpha-N-arabinofuranosidase